MTVAATAPKYRITSLDILRGLVMLIMAIDHVRDVFHISPEPTDLAVTTPFLFFTRFITHFCAPSFVFLSGISAYIAGTRRTKEQLCGFLIKRGLWLIFVEVALITFGMTLDPNYGAIILQVIWAIGGSMILLGLLVYTGASVWVIGAIGSVIFFGHNIIDVINAGELGQTMGWTVLLSAGSSASSFVTLAPGHFLIIGYALLPWAGVMFLGYAFGTLYKTTADAVNRRKILLYTGLSLLALFLVFRYFNLYGDPAPWAAQKTAALSVISFFNVTKYPCSLLYLSLTIGVSLILLYIFENLNGRFADVLVTYGNVPFFYYVCHWYLIQVMHLVAFFSLGFTTKQITTPNSLFLFEPPGFDLGLGGVYAIWLLLVVILYFPCRWFAEYKKTHHQWWLSYI